MSLPITRRGHWPSADQCFPVSPAHQGDRVVLERALQPHLQAATGRPTECRQRCQRIELAPLFGQLRRGQACVPGSGSRRGRQRIRSIATLSNVRFRELRQALRTARMGAIQPFSGPEAKLRPNHQPRLRIGVPQWPGCDGCARLLPRLQTAPLDPSGTHIPTPSPRRFGSRPWLGLASEPAGNRQSGSGQPGGNMATTLTRARCMPIALLHGARRGDGQ